MRETEREGKERRLKGAMKGGRKRKEVHSEGEGRKGRVKRE